MVKITIIGGGSSTFTPRLITSFVGSKALSGGTITLMDIDSQRLELMAAFSRRLVKKEGVDLKIESTTNQRESLVDSDFVITAISAGGFDAWEDDIEIPAKYGIHTVVSDSVGPGGIMRAFRHIPVLVGVCKDLEDVSPRAVLFNYTNPCTANTIATNSQSRIKSVGLCTCSSYTRNKGRYLSNLVGVEHDDLSLPAPAAGLNHCAAILELRLKDGQDAVPRLRKGPLNPVERWVLENYGVFPYCWKHWTEFFPSLSHLDEEYRGRGQGLTLRYDLRTRDLEQDRRRVEQSEKLVREVSRGERDISPEALKNVSMESLEGVEVVRIIEAMLENRNEVFVVNVRNRGAIENLPDNAIVEVSCVVGRYGFQPIHVGRLPDPIAALLSTYVTVQELTAEAAVSGDFHTALKAFLSDPQVSSKLTPERTEVLLKDLLSAHTQRLPRFVGSY